MIKQHITIDSLSLDALPVVLRVEEAAAVLRIGRSAAYALARRYRETAGREGLPVPELGHSLRVPRAALLRLIEAADPSSNGPAR